MNGRMQMSNQINNYVTPKRNSSKAKELKGKNQNNSNLSNAAKPQQRINVMNNKQDVPHLPIHNIEQINKYSDDRIKDIKFINLQLNDEYNGNSYISKNSNVRKSSVDVVKLKPGTPKFQKPIYFPDKNLNKYNTNNPIKSNKHENTNHQRKIRLHKFSKEKAIILIQRAFRKFLKRLKINPKFEMSNLLKKKKLSLLKNYISNNNHQISSLVHLDESDSIQANKVEKNQTNNNFSKLQVREEEKITANFFGNTINEKKNIIENKLLNEKENKEMNQNNLMKYNFIDDNESFLSYKNYLDNPNNPNKNTPIANQDDSKYCNKEITKEDKNLEKLKMSLDKFSDNFNKNKSIQSNNNDKSYSVNDNIKYNQNNLLINPKDQTAIPREDISDTVNIYEKIFKEIKLEEKRSSQKSSINMKNATSSKEDKPIKFEELNNNIQIIEPTSNSEINNTNQKKENENSFLESISDYRHSSTSIKKDIKNLEFPKEINFNRSTSQTENKIMVDRLNNMLEKEQMKSNIESKLLSSPNENQGKNSTTFKDDTVTNLDNNHTLNKSLQIPENKSMKDETQEKINKIYSILEGNEVNNRFNSILKYPEQSDRPNISQINTQNTAEILNMALELRESKKTTETMKSIIEELKKEIKSKEESHKKELQEKLSIQKHDLDNIIERQSGLIEGLLTEKKKLSQISDELNEKLENIERINHKKIQQMIENFDLELKKNKDAWFQAEKIRRKKWEDQKLKEIKENTVKGLEPEIERILSSHKQELSRMEDKLTEELRRQKEKLLNENERRISELKERFHKEKEETIEHERALNNQRMRNQSERLEEEFNEDRRRWNSNLQAEIHRLETLREKDKKLNDDQLGKIEERNLKLIEEKENYYKTKITEMERRFEDKLKFEEESYKLKFIKEKEKFIEEKQKEYENKTREMKNELIKDRDKQIQIIIEKLGEETINEKKKIQIECERKADEINKNLKIENEQLKQKIGELSDKLAAESKVRLMLDDNLEVLTRKLQEKEREIAKKEKQLMELNSSHNQIDTKYSNLVKDFNREKLDIELEYKGKIQKVEGEYKLLNDKLDSVKNYYEGKINEIHSFHKNEIIEIEEKIKKNFFRKDEIIKKLQEETQLKDITIQKYEDLLAKQRRELLSGH